MTSRTQPCVFEFLSFSDFFAKVAASSLLLDDDTKHTEQNVVGPSFALADVYCPFQDGAERSRMNQRYQYGPAHD